MEAHICPDGRRIRKCHSSRCNNCDGDVAVDVNYSEEFITFYNDMVDKEYKQFEKGGTDETNV